MNILIITPFYQIEGREDLIQDTCAVHYLVRPWASEHNVKVVYLYRNKFSKAFRYLKRENRNYYKKGYHYETDGVDVFLVEIQTMPHQNLNTDYRQRSRVYKLIEKYFSQAGFWPELVVTHMPTLVDGFIGDMFKECNRVAVLHSTDIINSNNYSDRYTLMVRGYDKYFARSKVVYEYFRNRGLHDLREEIVCSGVPEKGNLTLRKGGDVPEVFKIMYAGKLVERKHVDLVIKALSNLKDKYKFTFDIYGSGDEEKKLQILAHDLLSGDTVFHGQVSRNTILDAMEQSDLFVMASTRETLGLVYIEAMSRGCIPIGVEGEGIDGVIIDGKNGFLVKPNSVDSLINVFENIFTMNKELYAALVRSTEEAGSYYNENDMGLRYLNLVTDSEGR